MALVGKVLKGGGVLGVGMGVIDGGMTYYDRRSEHPDESKLTSAAFAAGNVALWAFLPGVAMAKEAFDITRTMGQSGMFNHHLWEGKALGRNDIGGSWNYQDTQQAATMRQRGVDAISQSRMNARSALGGEARALFRGAY